MQVTPSPCQKVDLVWSGYCSSPAAQTLPRCLLDMINNGEEHTISKIDETNHTNIRAASTVPNQVKCYNYNKYNNTKYGGKKVFSVVCCSSMGRKHRYGMKCRYTQLSEEGPHIHISNIYADTYDNPEWVERQIDLYRQYKEQRRQSIDEKEFHRQLYHHLLGDLYGNNRMIEEEEEPVVKNKRIIKNPKFDTNIFKNRLYCIRSLVAEGSRRDFISITEKRQSQLQLEGKYNILLSLEDKDPSSPAFGTTITTTTTDMLISDSAMKRERFLKKCAHTEESYCRAIHMHRLYWAHVEEDLRAILASDQPGAQEAMINMANAHPDRITSLAQLFDYDKPISFDAYTMAKSRISHRHIWRCPVASCYNAAIQKHAARYFPCATLQCKNSSLSNYYNTNTTGPYGEECSSQSRPKGGIYNGLICEAEAIREPYIRHEAWKQRQLKVLEKLPVIVLPNNNVKRLNFLQFPEQSKCEASHNPYPQPYVPNHGASTHKAVAGYHHTTFPLRYYTPQTLAGPHTAWSMGDRDSYSAGNGAAPPSMYYTVNSDLSSHHPTVDVSGDPEGTMGIDHVNISNNTLPSSTQGDTLSTFCKMSYGPSGGTTPGDSEDDGEGSTCDG